MMIKTISLFVMLALMYCNRAISIAAPQKYLTPQISSLDVHPQTVLFKTRQDRTQLVVSAVKVELSNRPGSDLLFDATILAKYSAEDKTIAVVSDTGVITPLSSGKTNMVIEYNNHRKVIPITVEFPKTKTPIVFDSQVLPIFTKAGCNAGKCHGSPNGKGGFALSLRGFDLDNDYRQLTRENFGRRINLLQPEKSLILQKAIHSIPHRGGKRFQKDDPLYRLIQQWITEGAGRSTEIEKPISLSIYPRQRWLRSEFKTQQIRVVAHWSNGTTSDVTHLAAIEMNSLENATLSNNGLLHRKQGGEVTVFAKYANLQANSQIVFIKANDHFHINKTVASNFIDRRIIAKANRLRINTSKPCDDATFIRRASLDLCGVIPSVKMVREFLADRRTDKRKRLIQRLLESPDYALYWAMKWSDRLGCNQRFVGKIGALKFHRWIENRIATNLPEDQFVQQIITASGGNYTNPPASFYRLPRTPAKRAEHVSQIFLGIRIGCAKCHNHPGERWTQDDYYGLAAFFARIKYRDGPFFLQKYDKEETIIPTRTGEVVHSRTGVTVAPKLLDHSVVYTGRNRDRREVFSDWLTSAENQWFAKASVNRIWFHLMGRGLVSPVDDFRSSNPASHPKLLTELAEYYVKNKFDRKKLIQKIMQSQVYQFSSQGDVKADLENRYFTRSRIRLLGAEQLLDSMSQATATFEKFKGFPINMRAAALPDGEQVHRFLTTFGRPARSLACACERESDTNFSQALELIGGDILEKKLRSKSGRIAKFLQDKIPDKAVIEELYLATVSRFPSKTESAEMITLLKKSKNRRQTMEDAFWALMNHREFLFQH